MREMREEGPYRWRIAVQLWMACLCLGLWVRHGLHSIWSFLL